MRPQTKNNTRCHRCETQLDEDERCPVCDEPDEEAA